LDYEIYAGFPPHLFFPFSNQLFDKKKKKKKERGVHVKLKKIEVKLQFIQIFLNFHFTNRMRMNHAIRRTMSQDFTYRKLSPWLELSLEPSAMDANMFLFSNNSLASDVSPAKISFIIKTSISAWVYPCQM
jgi:hypothetical protein